MPKTPVKSPLAAAGLGLIVGAGLAGYQGWQSVKRGEIEPREAVGGAVKQGLLFAAVAAVSTAAGGGKGGGIGLLGMSALGMRGGGGMGGGAGQGGGIGSLLSGLIPGLGGVGGGQGGGRGMGQGMGAGRGQGAGGAMGAGAGRGRGGRRTARTREPLPEQDFEPVEEREEELDAAAEPAQDDTSPTATDAPEEGTQPPQA